jgi:hypothetical protein
LISVPSVRPEVDHETVNALCVGQIVSPPFGERTVIVAAWRTGKKRAKTNRKQPGPLRSAARSLAFGLFI